MRAELAVGHRAAHATPPLALGFALLGALLALGTMRALETDALDPWAFYAGIAAATALGAVTAYSVQRLRAHPGWRLARWLLVPIAGGLVGMTVQAVLLRIPAAYTGPTTGLTKQDPASWILAGAALGALPAMAAAALLALCLRTAGRSPPLDARERMIVPLAGAVTVFSAAAFGFAASAEKAPLAVVTLTGAARARRGARPRRGAPSLARARLRRSRSVRRRTVRGRAGGGGAAGVLRRRTNRGCRRPYRGRELSRGGACPARVDRMHGGARDGAAPAAAAARALLARLRVRARRGSLLVRPLSHAATGTWPDRAGFDTRGPWQPYVVSRLGFDACRSCSGPECSAACSRVSPSAPW